MSLSLIAKSIKASPTLKLNEKFAILKEKGDPVIHLGGGEPKTRVPMEAILATVAHVNTGEVTIRTCRWNSCTQTGNHPLHRRFL